MHGRSDRLRLITILVTLLSVILSRSSGAEGMVPYSVESASRECERTKADCLKALESYQRTLVDYKRLDEAQAVSNELAFLTEYFAENDHTIPRSLVPQVLTGKLSIDAWNATASVYVNEQKKPIKPSQQNGDPTSDPIKLKLGDIVVVELKATGSKSGFRMVFQTTNGMHAICFTSAHFKDLGNIDANVLWRQKDNGKEMVETNKLTATKLSRQPLARANMVQVGNVATESFWGSNQAGCILATVITKDMIISTAAAKAPTPPTK